MSLLSKLISSGPLRIFAQTAGARVLGMACSSLLVVLLARSLDPDQYGIYALFTTTYVFGNLLLGLNLSGNLIRRVPGADIAQASRLLATFVVAEMALGAGLLALMVTLQLDRRIAAALEIAGHLTEFRVILLTIWVDLGAGACLNYLLARKQFGRANLLTLLRASLLGPLLGVVWLVTHSLNTGIIATAWLVCGGVSLVFAVLSSDLIAGFRRGFDFHLLRGAVGFGLMLASQSFAFYFLKLADRYLLARYATLADVGIYSFAYTLSNIVYSLSALVIVGLYHPHIVEAHNTSDFHKRDALLGQLTRTALVSVIVASAAAALLSPYAIVFARPSYAPSAAVLPWLLLILVPVVAAYPASIILMLEGKLWASLVGGTVAIALAVPLNVILVPRISYYGSLIASAIGFTLIAIVQHAVARSWRFLAPGQFRRLPQDLAMLLRGNHRSSSS